MKVFLVSALIATLFAFGCTAPNKFCVFENQLLGKKCVQLDDQITEGRCRELGGIPSRDCGK